MDEHSNQVAHIQPELTGQALRTPRAAAITYLLAIVLLVAINLSLWVIMVFPAWVFAISMYILVESLRGKTGQAAAAVGTGE